MFVVLNKLNNGFLVQGVKLWWAVVPGSWCPQLLPTVSTRILTTAGLRHPAQVTIVLDPNGFDTYPDPNIRIWWPKIVKFEKTTFFCLKIAIHLSPGHYKGRPSYRSSKSCLFVVIFCPLWNGSSWKSTRIHNIGRNTQQTYSSFFFWLLNYIISHLLIILPKNSLCVFE